MIIRLLAYDRSELMASIKAIAKALRSSHDIVVVSNIWINTLYQSRLEFKEPYWGFYLYGR